ncbi:fatty acyl-CoA reductase 1-like isoform X2 [Agrilus planipennis]|uniref:Fatty acyl-CoA reductase n=1 Tax=Agrilus planipennis TaxID=224129 RepID=A0A7F5RDT4_AGRPL|nr:fatty acyl-CoA reductase 1-like isoform X2 [Agrilus planipennis]
MTKVVEDKIIDRAAIIESQHVNRVVEACKGRTIFITGGTGFMGKVLVEKLLRTCIGIKRIYLLVRLKKGKQPDERLREMFKGVLFEKVKKLNGPDIVKKVVVIPGDVSLPNLGISSENRKILAEEVELVYHCAATIRFDETLKKAVLLNTRGTKYMLELAKEMKDLLVFVYVSTAYCHLNERVLYEKSYPPPANPHYIIKAVEWMDEEIVTSITDKLLGNCPNTYAFTKALAESLVDEQMDKLPVIIVRPSIVIPIWKEPVPGWTDNINGPTGLLIGAGKGIIRSMYCNSKGYADYLPVDVAVNGIIITSWDYIGFKKRRYYNLTSSGEIKVSWQQVIELGRRIVETKMPLNGVVWYPGGSMKKSKIMHLICVALFHYLPAAVIDFFICLSGNKPVLWRIQKRISKGFEVFEYYANNQWDFNNDDSLKARHLMNEKEKEDFKVDGKGLDLDEYFTHCVHATRLYILNEPDDTLPSARRHMLMMWGLDRLCKFILLLGLGYVTFYFIIAPLLGITL